MDTFQSRNESMMGTRAADDSWCDWMTIVSWIHEWYQYHLDQLLLISLSYPDTTSKTRRQRHKIHWHNVINFKSRTVSGALFIVAVVSNETSWLFVPGISCKLYKTENAPGPVTCKNLHQFLHQDLYLHLNHRFFLSFDIPIPS
jgi:hypothetical protein